jgi:hypothetical protein
MPSIPMKVADRIAAGVKKFKPLVAAAKAADVGHDALFLFKAVDN